MGGQTEGLGGDAAVVVLPALPPVGGEGAAALIAAAVFHKGLGDEDGAGADNSGVVGAGGAESFADGPLDPLVLDGGVAADLGVLPAGGVGGQRDDLFDLLAADGFPGKFPVAAPGQNTGLGVHRAFLRFD